MKVDNRILALALVGVLMVGYMGFVVYSAIAPSAQSPVDESPGANRSDNAQRVGDSAAASLAGDVHVRQLARKWDVGDLEAVMDPSVHSTDWYTTLKGIWPTYEDLLGPITTVQGSAEFKPRGNVDYYDYRGELECQKGRASVRMLLVAVPGGHRVMGLEVELKERDPSPTGPRDSEPKVRAGGSSMS